MKMNTDLIKDTLTFVADNYVDMFSLGELKIDHLIHLFLAQNGCHVSFLGHEFYCENATDFFTVHLRELQSQDSEDIEDDQAHWRAEMFLQCLTKGEIPQDNGHFKKHFTYTPNVSFIQWDKYNSYTLVVKVDEIIELKKFIDACKLDNANVDFNAFEYLKMRESIILKNELDKTLQEQTILQANKNISPKLKI